MNTLFDLTPAPTRRTDPRTSHNRVNKPRARTMVYEAMLALSVATDEQIEAWVASHYEYWTGQSLRRARKELAESGTLRQVGTGKTTRGGDTAIWGLTSTHHEGATT